MFGLRVVQAEYGDCLILEYGSEEKPRHILIDGGPADIYQQHLRGELEGVSSRGGKLDLAVLSHVDMDHVVGLLDLTSELREQREDETDELIQITSIWHNAFGDTIGLDNDTEERLGALLSASAAASESMTVASAAFLGIGEGLQLRRDARLLDIPINPETAGEPVTVGDEATSQTLGNLTLRVIGPTEANLANLREEWQTWLTNHADDIASGDPQLAANADKSAPNLSSIVLLAEAEGKRILLTGDARGDHIIQGLDQAGLLDEQGRMHVDILKLPHHGSDRNITLRYLRKISADRYVISANGRHGNPDPPTLRWILRAAREQKRSIEIVATNMTPSLEEMLAKYDTCDYGYRLTILPAGEHGISLGFGCE